MRKHVFYHMQTTEVHLRSLISVFVVRCLDSIVSVFAKTKISRLLLIPVCEQAGLSLTWSQTPEDTFSHDEAQNINELSLLCV